MANPAPILAKATGVFTSVAGSTAVTSLIATNRNAGVRYLLIWDQSVAPNAGQGSPAYQFVVGAQSQQPFDKATLGPNFTFATGLAYGFSTGNGTLTIGADADHDMQVMR